MEEVLSDAYNPKTKIPLKILVNKFTTSAYSFKRVTITIIKITSRRIQTMKEWLHSVRSKSGAVLMMMDVDYFKQINDNYGHAVGDRVLYKIGHLLKSSFRENDIVGRIGGDEFLIFMEGITSEEFAVRRMENLQQYLRELPIEELEEHTLTCSMGAAFMPKDGTTFGELYKHADEALYTTKRNGRDGFRIYHEVEEKKV